ncbi:valacyclovir hydrolase [Plutella xylostella]|uniref:valacyclovir hydrolase n=1 Tax=Plutella xylostella TaxID=51655 RepID=UPI002032995C|nr:valacyclovir hydrolase [Plutella xylostella]
MNSAVIRLTKCSSTKCLAMFQLSYHSQPKVALDEGISSHRVQVGPHRLHYLRAGHGPHTLLLIPGVLGFGWSNFKHQLLGFDRDLFTTIAFDPPGNGYSRPPEKTFPPLEVEAETVAQFMEALGVESASVLGYSSGGRTAMVLAALHQRLVKKLVLASTHAFILPDEYKYSRSLDCIEETWNEKEKNILYGVYGKENLPKLWRQFNDFNERILKEQRGNVCLHLLKDIKCPTQLICGQKDPLTKVENSWLLHALIENSRIHVYPEGKHSNQIKYAEDFNMRVQDFLMADEELSGTNLRDDEEDIKLAKANFF